jgi:HK97 gp10 family phage protein
MALVNYIVTGDTNIDKVLGGLRLEVNHTLLQKAHTSAGKKTVNTAKLLAPEGPTGRLIDSIGVVKTPIAKSNALGEVTIGPRRGRYGGHVAHLVELGTKERTLKGKGKYKAGTRRGMMPKKPFMEPAWNRTKDAVMNSINDFVGVHLYRYMKRTIKNV